MGLIALTAGERPIPVAVAFSRRGNGKRRFATLIEFLQARAARRPLLLIVEDLHWVDASTVEFLDNSSPKASTTASSPF